MDKKKIVISAIVISIILAILGIVYVFIRQDKNSTLTIMEKQWIENNKNNVIDISIVNNVPVFNYDGEGLFFDFLNSVEKDTGLSFNKLSYNMGNSISSEYSFQVVDELASNDILMYEDNYVLVTKNKVKYNSINDIPTLTIGVLNSDIKNVSYYLGANKKVSFKTYGSYNNLFSTLTSNSSPITAIAVPKTMFLKEIVENDRLTIAYDMPEIKKYFVLRLGSNKKLNRILTKYYKKWNRTDYEELFNTNFSESYFKFKQIYQQEKTNFTSKQYVYGFVENAPFDSLVDDKLQGFSNELIKSFTKVSNITVSYNRYKNYEELLKAFNENKIDFYLNASSLNDYDLDIYRTVSAYETKAVVLSKEKNETVINSEMALKGRKVATVRNSKIDKYLNSNDIKTHTYENVIDLLRNKDSDELVVIDEVTFEAYISNALKKYNKIYTFDLDITYEYVGRDIEANKVFNEYLNFYITFTNTNIYKNTLDINLFSIKSSNKKILLVVLVLLLICVVISSALLLRKMKPKKKKIKVSKEDKLKYVDMLTSLKNRNYLNDSIEKWDSAHIYPQAIVVVDLNNVAYINDNYGHEEGDIVIKEAASILIQTQIEQTEIIRTNGNEFLIYMLGHDEKKVVSYTKKLLKELKDLKHGFGAAVGYSMITDELKTIDDAINEATLDMKNKKEEIQN